jgi:hypothetical protein
LTPWVLPPAARMDLVSMRMNLDELADDHELAGLVDEVIADLGGGLQDRIPKNGNPSKIKPEKVSCFSSPKPDRQLTSFHHQSITTSPQKNHVLPPVFAKTPSKNAVPPPQKNYCKSTPPQAGFHPFRRMTTAATTLSWSSRSRTLAPQPTQLSNCAEPSRNAQKPRA